jgi:hypothetical protein
VRATLSLIVFGVLAACWTGSELPAATPPPEQPREPSRGPRVRVRLERTACLGACPTYTVVIHSDGRVQWEGRDNVIATGPRQGRVTAAELAVLVKKIDEARFFERDEHGELKQQPACTTANGATTCSYSATFCSDTPHAIISVTREGRTHRVDNDHCSEQPGLDELEDYIDAIANTQAWVGP